MHQLFESILEHANTNVLAPAICGAGRIVSYRDLVNALCNLCAAFEARGLAPGTKIFVNVVDPDIRLIAHLAAIHYGLVPFVLFGPSQVPGQVDHEFVVGTNDPLATDIPADLLIGENIFSTSDRPLSAWGNRPRADSDLMLVATTSGTTGQWKLIGETCGHFSFQLDKSHDYAVGDRTMVIMGELSLMTLRVAVRTLAYGATLVRASTDDQLTSLRMINLFAVNKLVVAPKTLDRLMDLMEDMSIRCPSLTSISVTGSLFVRSMLERAERLFDAEFIVLYGSSEVGGIAAGPVRSATFEPGYVGPIRNYLQVRIDAEQDGEPGQVVLRNDPVLIQRYYENGAIVPNEAEEYRMPDLGVIRDGCLYISGRDDEVYNYSGDKIAFSEIIDCLLAEEAVSDAAAIQAPGDPDPFGLKIAVVGKGTVDVERLRSLICDKLGRRTIGRHLDIRPVTQIRRNASDKVDRRALLAMFPQR